MQRNVLNLTSVEAALLLELTRTDLPELLKQKLEGIINTGQTQLFSQDEQEQLLDLLPPPTVQDPPTLRGLRERLRPL